MTSKHLLVAYIYVRECTMLLLGRNASGLLETYARHMLLFMYIRTDKGAKTTHEINVGA